MINKQKLLTVKEVSKILGVSTSTVYTMVHQRRIPVVILYGGSSPIIRFEPIALESWRNSF